jgi:hypothetical protein
MREIAELGRLLVKAIEEVQRVQQKDALKWSPWHQRILKDVLMLLERVLTKVRQLPGDSP